MTVRILIGDVRQQLRRLPSESVHCVVTSPPYYGLRNYSVDGQIGLEPTWQEHVATIVEVFREVRRVLRKDGTCWMNYGDAYATSINGTSAHDTKLKGNDDRAFRDKPFSTIGNGLKPKDMMGIPWRVAFALQADGWWLRQDIIWAKPNPMPESIRDRCTKAHEYLFLLAKSERYYFDQEAIAEPALYAGDLKTGLGSKLGIDDDATHHRTRLRGERIVPDMRNRRSVWTIATAPYTEAHFATFPPEMPELCIKAGTSQKGYCSACRRPWVRQLEELNPGAHPTVKDSGGMSILRGLPQNFQRPRTLGWAPSCSCNAGIVRATVLDPFGGAGTTGLVADRLQRHAILIELNPEYAAMARARIDGDRGGLLDLMEAAQ